MLRPVSIFVLLFCCSAAAAQQNLQATHSSFRTKQLTAKELSIQLTEGKASDYDKVRSIFDWITENISYRSQQISKRSVTVPQVDDDTSAVLKPLNERVAEIVLRNRLAVCDGYARLFKTLCDYAGVRAEIVTGFVRNGTRTSGKFQTNHSWNAVMLDGKWHLVDATWASGYVNFSGQFIRQYDRNFFLADPADMLQTHYPENPFWTLMKDHKMPAEFHSQPLKYFAWHGAYIDRHFPRSGIIEVRAGEPVTVSLGTKEAKHDLILITDPFGIKKFSSNGWQRNFIVEGQNITGTWLPGNDKPDWLYVVLNGEVIMRYSLRYN